jgi:cytochrome c
MIKTIATFLIGATIAAPAFAESHVAGNVAAGEKAFKKCTTCHVVIDDEGQTLAGKKAKTGPNLYGVIGRQAARIEGFRYGKSIIAAGEAGLIWDPENFAAYVQDPKAFLKEILGDKSARSKMSFKVRAEEDAVNLAAFLASLGPEAEDAAANN